MYVRTAVGLGQPKREQIPEERLLRQVMENGLQFQAEIAGRVRDIKLSPGVARSPYLPKRHPESREYWALPRDERAKVAATVSRIFKEATRIVRNLDPKDPKDKPWIRIWLTLRDIVMRVRAEEATPTGRVGPVQTVPNQPAPQRPGPVRPWPWPPRPPQPPQPPQPSEPPVIDPGWRPPRVPLPDLSPKEILDRAKEVLEFLKRNNGDQSLIQKIENLLRKAAPIISLAGAILGLYVFAKGRLVQMIAATGMVLPRILHRFETSDMKDQLERILSELTGSDINRAIEDEARRIQPRGQKSALTECQEQHDFFPICEEQFDIGPEKIVMNFLKNERIDPDDVLGINCRKFNSFGPGKIDACNHGPGETWHCTVTTKVPGSPKPYVRVVSLFHCHCCRADGWTAHDWRGPHWSAG